MDQHLQISQQYIVPTAMCFTGYSTSQSDSWLLTHQTAHCMVTWLSVLPVSYTHPLLKPVGFVSLQDSSCAVSAAPAQWLFCLAPIAVPSLLLGSSGQGEHLLELAVGI